MEIRKQGEYYGSQRWELEQKGISLSEYDYHEPNTPWHFHENPYFMYVLHGQMKDLNKRESTCLDSGSLMFLNWEELHKSEKYSQSGRGFHLQIDRSWLVCNDLDASLWEGSKKMHDPQFHRLMGQIYFEFKRKDKFSTLAIEMLVIQLCDILNNNSKPSVKSIPSWISNLHSLILEDDNLSLDDISIKLGIHPVHISRTVPIFFNTSLGTYLRATKIKKTIPMLINNDKALGQIAHDCGFSDHSYFTRSFKSYFGITPGTFRKQVV